MNEKKTAIPDAVRLMAFSAFVLISGITSMAFFATYAAGLFAFFAPTMAPYLAALVGFTIFEGACTMWAYLRVKDADTSDQISYAGLGMYGTMIGGMLVTVCYFALNTSLIYERLDGQTLTGISLLSGLLIIAGVLLNFGLSYFYRNSSASQQQARHEAEIRAMRAEAEQTIQREMIVAELDHTLQNIRKGLQPLAQQTGQRKADELLSRTFAAQPEEAHTANFQNGDPQD